jgi:hypothetical protein
MTTSLEYLKQTGTTVVSDSGDFECEYTSMPPVFFRLIKYDKSSYCRLQAPSTRHMHSLLATESADRSV